MADYSHDLCVVHLMHSSSNLWVRSEASLSSPSPFPQSETFEQSLDTATHSLISSTNRHSSTLFPVLFTIALMACLSSVKPSSSSTLGKCAIISTKTKSNYTTHSNSWNALWHCPRSADDELLCRRHYPFPLMSDRTCSALDRNVSSLNTSSPAVRLMNLVLSLRITL